MERLKCTLIGRVHTTKQRNTHARMCTCARTRVHAPDPGFRIHLTRTIDHECTSDRADLLKKSSYLHSPRIVGFRIKRRAAGWPRRRFPRRGQPSQVCRTNLLEMPCTRWLQRIAVAIVATFDETGNL